MKYVILLLTLAPLGYGEVVPGRYIVELDGDSVAVHVARQRGRGGLRGAAAEARRSTLRGEQARARQQLGGGVTVNGAVENVGNALLVSVPDGDVERLRALPGVRRVRQVRTVKRLLDRAVVVNKVSEAWDRIGDANAGTGMKVAIIDTGVDNAHPSLRDSGLQAPDSYPRTNASTDDAFTNGKVIVARSYVDLLARRDPDASARDHVGHGTALAVIVAGSRTAAPLATIQGVAPQAYIGSYKVFGTPGYNDGATNAAILKAIDDAVADGMDVINLSLGDDIALRLDEDELVQAVEQASKAGVLVVCAAGNNGPDFGTISTPATAPSAIAVGATRNDRTFGASVEVEGLGVVLALRGNGIAPENPITGPLADVAALDGGGLACNTLPPGSLNGQIALILRGDCTFETKLGNAQRAGAAAAVIYAAALLPDAFSMDVGQATLPAESVSNADGLAMKERGGAAITMRFTIGSIPQTFDRITSFSAIGPNVDLTLKPDLVAVGQSFYVATQSYNPNGDMYSADGYAVVQGTSFSSPMAAGALALLKSARPGLTTEQYRSLLINNTTDVADFGGDDAVPQKTGAGQLNLGASIQAGAAASPALLNLGSGAAGAATLRVDNLTGAAETFTLTVEPKGGGAGPALSAAALELGPGESGESALSLDGGALPAGAYAGVVHVKGAATGTEIRVPYWYVVPGQTPAAIPLISLTASGRRNGLLRDAVYFRVTDAAGVPIAGVRPEVSVISGGGSALTITSYDADSPGLFSATVRLGPVPQVNTFRIQAGEMNVDVKIAGQ